MARKTKRQKGRGRASENSVDRPKRVALYVRVSSDEQTKNWSLTSQRKAGSDYCAAKGWELVEVYADEGHSAWREKAELRPEYLRMMADVEKECFDIVVTYSFDRMSRDLLNMFRTIKTFRDYGVSLVAIREDLDFSGPMGTVLMALFSALAEMQSTNISYNAKRGMRERKEHGLPHGRPPLGYQRCDDSCRREDENHPYWHIVQEDALLVHEAFELYAGRFLSMSRIADVLNSRRPESESRFTHDRVSSMLRNCHYAGMIPFRNDGEDEPVPGVQVPIVDKRLFDDVQKRLDSNAMDFNRRGRRSKIGHVLSRLARCYDCGNKFNVTVQGAQSKESYYRMYKRATGTACHYAGRSFSGRDVNAQVDQLFSCFRLREGWHQTVIDKYISNADVDIIQAQRDTIEDRIKRLDARFDVGTLTEADFRKEFVRLKEELNRLQLPETDDITKAGELLEDFGQIWRGSTRNEQNELLQLILDAVYIDPDNRRIVSIQPKGPFASLIREMVERSDIRLEEDYQPPFSRKFSEHGSMSRICCKSMVCISVRGSGSKHRRTRAWRVTPPSTKLTPRTSTKAKSGSSRPISNATG